ncbi:MAG: hypothetical protein QXI32_05100 [Candidatus Bathyarchaeia archaeon]
MSVRIEEARKLVTMLVRKHRFPDVIRRDILSKALTKEGYEENVINAVLTDITVGALNRLNYDPEILVGLEQKEKPVCGIPFPFGFDQSGPNPICCFGLPITAEQGTLYLDYTNKDIVYSHCSTKAQTQEFVKKYRCVPLRKR